MRTRRLTLARYKALWNKLKGSMRYGAEAGRDPFETEEEYKARFKRQYEDMPLFIIMVRPRGIIQFTYLKN